jgi:hypothetical protein
MLIGRKVVCEFCLKGTDENEMERISDKPACAPCRSPEAIALRAYFAAEQQQIIDNTMRLSLAYQG